MPDISMCSNKKCPKRKQCYRFMVTPGKWQAYTDFDYDEVEGCPAFRQWYSQGKVKDVKKDSKSKG